MEYRIIGVENISKYLCYFILMVQIIKMPIWFPWTKANVEKIRINNLTKNS